MIIYRQIQNIFYLWKVIGNDFRLYLLWYLLGFIYYLILIKNIVRELYLKILHLYLPVCFLLVLLANNSNSNVYHLLSIYYGARTLVSLKHALHLIPMTSLLGWYYCYRWGKISPSQGKQFGQGHTVSTCEAVIETQVVCL